MEVGDDGEANDHGADVGVNDGVGQVFDPAVDHFGGYRFADPAQGEAAEGDAELDCGEEAVEVLLEAADGAGSGDSGSNELLDAGVAHGDEGELGSHKEGVGQDEDGHGDDLEKRESVHGVRFQRESIEKVVGGNDIHISAYRRFPHLSQRRNESNKALPCGVSRTLGHTLNIDTRLSILSRTSVRTKTAPGS